MYGRAALPGASCVFLAHLPLQTQRVWACLASRAGCVLSRARRTGHATVCCSQALKGCSLRRSQWQPSQPRQRDVYWLAEAAAPSAPARPPPQRFTLLGPWLAGLVVVCTTICFLCSAAAAFILYVRPLLQARHRLLCRAAPSARAACLSASVVSGIICLHVALRYLQAALACLQAASGADALVCRPERGARRAGVRAGGAGDGEGVPEL